MRDLLLLLIVVASVPVTFMQPFAGIVMWHWLSLMNPHRLTWGYAYDFRFALIVAVTTIVAWLISRESKKLPNAAPVYWLAAFTFWISVTVPFAHMPDAAYDKWVGIIKILGMTFVTLALVVNRQRITWLTWVAVISLGFYGVKGGLFTLMTGGGGRVYGPALSFIADNNALAQALVMVLPLMRHLQVTATHVWLRRGMWAAMGLTCLAVLATYSRGGLVALAVVLSLLWVKSRHKLATALALICVLVAILPVLPEKWYGRMATIAEYDTDGSTLGRFQAWTFAYKLAVDRPITGGGFRVFTDEKLYMSYVPEALRARNFHSIYFEVLGESGFMGLILFLGLGVSTLLLTWRIMRATRGRPELAWAASLAAMIQVAILGYAAAGTFQNFGFFDFYYTLIALAVGTWRVVQREMAKTPALDAPATTPTADGGTLPAPGRA
jgi:probable O-glycosylation ligase (exosortase A-associated)